MELSSATVGTHYVSHEEYDSLLFPPTASSPKGRVYIDYKWSVGRQFTSTFSILFFLEAAEQRSLRISEKGKNRSNCFSFPGGRIDTLTLVLTVGVFSGPMLGHSWDPIIPNLSTKFSLFHILSSPYSAGASNTSSITEMFSILQSKF